MRGWRLFALVFVASMCLYEAVDFLRRGFYSWAATLAFFAGLSISIIVIQSRRRH